MNATLYSASHYFLDTLYRKFFEPLHAGFIPVVTPEMIEHHIIDTSLEVWVSIQANRIDPRRHLAAAYVDLPPLTEGSLSYDSSLVYQKTFVVGRSVGAYFSKLYPSQFELDPYGGVISLNVGLLSEQAIAVSYRTSGGLSFGESTMSLFDTTGLRPLVLKLIKPPNLQPEYKPAWDLMLKNIYYIGKGWLNDENFSLTIYFETDYHYLTANFLGHSLLSATGLDRFSRDGRMIPDGAFDYIPGLTVNKIRSEIIFPNLRPFDSGIQSYYKSLGLAISDSILFRDVYDASVPAAWNSTQNRYHIVFTKTFFSYQREFSSF